MTQYTIKPLMWECGEIGRDWTASVPFGWYTAEDDKWGYCFDECFDYADFGCASIEEGKAAAEADWLRRILPALTAVEGE